MIQRIQTLFILGTVILSGSLFFIPFLYSDGDSVHLASGFNGNKKLNAESLLYAFIVNSAVIVSAVAMIFLYKNRRAQMKLGRLVILLLLAEMALMFMLDFFVLKESNAAPQYQAGAYFPLLSLLFIFMAVRAIKKDEELVRSADRIR